MPADMRYCKRENSQRISENLGERKCPESHRKVWNAVDVRAMKHAARLAEWSKKIQACRSSGMTVKDWCEENNVSAKTYYNWEKAYLAAAGQQMILPEEASAVTGQLVRIDPERLPETVEESIPAPSMQTTSNVRITLRYGGMSVEMPAGMEIAQIAVLMKALGTKC